MVYGNGIADSPGTWLRALLDLTSWNVSPGNSGTCTLRSSPRIDGMPGSVEASSTSSRWASHRMPSIRTHVRTNVQPAAGSDRRAVLVERGEHDRRPRGDVRGRPDVLEQVLERVRRGHPHLEDVAL